MFVRTITGDIFEDITDILLLPENGEIVFCKNNLSVTLPIMSIVWISTLYPSDELIGASPIIKR